jgi:hypothetical protein
MHDIDNFNTNDFLKPSTQYHLDIVVNTSTDPNIYAYKIPEFQTYGLLKDLGNMLLDNTLIINDISVSMTFAGQVQEDPHLTFDVEYDEFGNVTNAGFNYYNDDITDLVICQVTFTITFQTDEKDENGNDLIRTITTNKTNFTYKVDTAHTSKIDINSFIDQKMLGNIKSDGVRNSQDDKTQI